MRKNLNPYSSELTFFWIKILRRAGLKHLKYQETVFVLPDNRHSTDITTLTSSSKVNAKINTEALQGYRLI